LGGNEGSDLMGKMRGVFQQPGTPSDSIGNQHFGNLQQQTRQELMMKMLGNFNAHPHTGQMTPNPQQHGHGQGQGQEIANHYYSLMLNKFYKDNNINPVAHQPAQTMAQFGPSHTYSNPHCPQSPIMNGSPMPNHHHGHTQNSKPQFNFNHPSNINFNNNFTNNTHINVNINQPLPPTVNFGSKSDLKANPKKADKKYSKGNGHNPQMLWYDPGQPPMQKLSTTEIATQKEDIDIDSLVDNLVQAINAPKK
jgi:hypothetical protein